MVWRRIMGVRVVHRRVRLRRKMIWIASLPSLGVHGDGRRDMWARHVHADELDGVVAVTVGKLVRTT